MFRKEKDIEKFSKKVYLASPTMHGEELNFDLSEMIAVEDVELRK